MAAVPRIHCSKGRNSCFGFHVQTVQVVMAETKECGLFEFIRLIGRLKRVQRAGWVLRGIEHPESVADHMYRMAVMAMLAPKELDVSRCVKMALVHDMAECIVGDITPNDGVSKQEKVKLEEAAMKQLCLLLGNDGQEIYSLWQDYEQQHCAEAHFVKDLDLMDMVTQAYEYECLEQRHGYLQEFFDSTEGRFTTDIVKDWKCKLDLVRAQNSLVLKEKNTSPDRKNLTPLLP